MLEWRDRHLQLIVDRVTFINCTSFLQDKHKMRMTMGECLNRGIVIFQALTDDEIAEEAARKAARYKTPKKKKAADG